MPLKGERASGRASHKRLPNRQERVSDRHNKELAASAQVVVRAAAQIELYLGDRWAWRAAAAAAKSVARRPTRARTKNNSGRARARDCHDKARYLVLWLLLNLTPAASRRPRAQSQPNAIILPNSSSRENVRAPASQLASTREPASQPPSQPPSQPAGQKGRKKKIVRDARPLKADRLLLTSLWQVWRVNSTNRRPSSGANRGAPASEHLGCWRAR